MKEAMSKQKAWDWNEHKPNNMLNIPCSSRQEMFNWWCVFLDSFIHLTDREREVVVSFLNHRLELSKIIPDPAIVDDQLMGDSVKEEILKECNMTLSHYYVVMSNLKKKNVITSRGINPRLIPNIREDDKGTFLLLISFKETQKK